MSNKRSNLHRYLLRLKLVSAMLLLSLLQVSARAFSQPVTLHVKNASLEEVFRKLHDQYKLDFVYDVKMLGSARKVSVAVTNESLKSVLDKCFDQQPLTYELFDNTVVVKALSNAAPRQSKSFTVSGKVADSKGGELPGVSIQLKGTTTATVTNEKGLYTLRLPEDTGTLVFSFMGFITQEVPVLKRAQINVTLQDRSTDLNDVVIVGYGQQKKISMIGAQSTIRAEELKQPVANLTNLIAGRVAGMIGVQRSGEPGHDNAEIYIRGISTFTNSSPLVLVDGIERSFSNVDPEDIASFSILKDASATAVYGVRGANGVILITTKQGKPGRVLINAQYDQGITQFTKVPEFADGITYMQMANEASRNSFPTQSVPYSEEMIKRTQDQSDPDLYPNVDWIGTLFAKSGQNRRARVNANGGSDKAKYYLSVGYYDEDGLYNRDQLAGYDNDLKFTRYNFTANLNLDITKTTKVDFGASGWISDGNYPGKTSSAIWSAAYNLPPIAVPVKYSNGLHSQLRTIDVTNPYNDLTQTGYVSEFRSQLWSNIRISQDLGFWLKGLSATAMYSFDNYNSHTINRTKSVEGYLATGRDADGNLMFDRTAVGDSYLGYSRSNGGNRQYYTEASINYVNKFGNHAVSGMLLYNQSDKEDAFAGDFIYSLPYRYMGLAGRATYGYADRYLAEVNFGYNGSETFAPGKRFGFFPSYGLGWVVSEEQFFEPVKKIFQFMKFRYSYGLVGNSNIGGRRFAYIGTVGTGNGGYSYGANGMDNNISGTDIGDYAVDVTWEEAEKSNLGIEMRFWDNNISLVADLFREKRTGIFMQRGDVPNYAGIRILPWANLGEVHNRGVDATLEVNKKIGNDFTLGFRGNVTWNRAMVVDDAKAPWPYPWQQNIGRKMGQRFGYTALGLFRSQEEIDNAAYQTGTNRPGDIRYKDLNGDGKIDSYDQGPIGYGSMPEIVYGFGPNISWKGWSLAGWFKGISNVDIQLSGDGFQPFSRGGNRGNLMSKITDRWTPENNAARPFYPRLTYGADNMNYAGSNWWTKNGAFLRLQTLQLSYNFRENWMRHLGMSDLNMYFIGYNLMTVSQFDLWDVELGDGRGASYPLTKTFNFGIKCTFK
ncbi:TonB-dependent receptor [Chitinophaga horti]|uniref:TonB-dependent receptor n=1 Tax=Chitinophaga horti TaxID=2920382 RepID=A0ABY6J8K6_9BACT|nr:TonB-dependent receptor [Chitinophaga horti]UYQ95937.1 TonB-dependent receptor [Chitinophaga horti]